MTGYFIAATGTGVGKTFTTCALLHGANEKCMSMSAFKPVISGWSNGAETDTAQIVAAGGNRQTIDEVSRWKFRAPLSPHMAAAQEGMRLSLDEVVDWSKQALANQSRISLIEGVGGIAVPINDEHTTLDWMRALNLPVILVTGSYLGSISHTLTALMALQTAGVTVKALVVNESQGSSVTFAEADEGLAPFIRTIELRIFQPRVSSYKEALAIHELIAHL